MEGKNGLLKGDALTPQARVTKKQSIFEEEELKSAPIGGVSQGLKQTTAWS